MNTNTFKTMRGLFVGALALGALLVACDGGGSTKPSNECPEPGLCTPMSQLVDTGATLFMSCGGCHGLSGRGHAGAVPPLANSDFFMDPANRERIIGIVLGGTNDSLYVNGMWYQGDMPAHSFYSNLEIAGILTYIRSVLTDSTVVSCRDYDETDSTSYDPIEGFAVCEKTPRAQTDRDVDSVAVWEVKRVRDTLQFLEEEF